MIWREDYLVIGHFLIKYGGDLKSRQVWILKGGIEVGLQMVWISNGIWNPEAQPSTILSKTFLNLDKNVYICNGPVFEWLGLQLLP